MSKFLLFKHLYIEAFRNLSHRFMASYLKVLTWSCLALIGVVTYAFIYRMATGFYF
ncbi:DUF6747 family protein [Leptobacterium flavescens]|uniref:DUF6747 family protein n=1 Tax=Leptobacterium flavescens TaxID=472055 RepID=UPI00293BEE00|nr:DUF6747 family protein [Leptobacterium flavescens]